MKAFVLTVASVLAIALAWWGFSILISGPKGQGDAIIINNSVENWTQKQEKFEKLNAAVDTNKELVALHRSRVAADPTDKTTAQMLAGVQSECIASVSAYNAEARKVLSQDWRSSDLPQTLTTVGCN
jgi:hypothetical protein